MFRDTAYGHKYRGFSGWDCWHGPVHRCRCHITEHPGGWGHRYRYYATGVPFCASAELGAENERQFLHAKIERLRTQLKLLEERLAEIEKDSSLQDKSSETAAGD